MLILLDIDGVMVPAKSWKKPEFHADGFPEFGLKAVQALQKIIAETNAGVLLTTSHKDRYSLPEWQTMFQSRGVSISNIKRLSPNKSNLNRKDEILNWYAVTPEPPEHFVIIDDDKLLSGLPRHIKKNLVLTSPSVGLTDELAAKAIAILNQKKLLHA